MNTDRIIRKLVAKGRLHPIVSIQKQPQEGGEPKEVKMVVAVGRKPRSRKARQFFALKTPVPLDKFDIKTHFNP